MLRCLAISAALGLLAGCVTDGVTGFKPVYLKPASIAYLSQHDPGAADAILANNEFGEKTAGFKPPTGKKR